MKEFGLLPNWTFKWDNAKKRFGRCCYNPKTISLSRHLTKLNSREMVEETIRHEIAHAKDAEERGFSDHSKHWQRWAVKCGASPERCFSPVNVQTPEAPLYTYCPNCKQSLPRYRKMKPSRVYSCGQCAKGFNPDYAVIPNIPLSKKQKMEEGDITWRELPQTERVASFLKNNSMGSLFLKKYKNGD